MVDMDSSDGLDTSSPEVCEVCEEYAYLSCSVCTAVYYCSTSHQEEHAPKHQAFCRTYKVERSLKLGPHLVSAKNLRKGDAIFEENPLAVGPALKGAIPWSCLGCHRAVFPEHASTCPGCLWPACSRTCAGLSDRDIHGSECQLLKIVKDVTGAFRMDLLMPLRCLLLQTTQPGKWKQLQEIARRSSAEHVNSVPDRDTVGLLKDFQTLSERVSHLIPDCSGSTVRNVFALLALRGQGMFTANSGPLVAVYAASSLLVHSCVPNVTILRKRDTLLDKNPAAFALATKSCGRVTLQATRDIRKGEVLTYPLANLFYSTLERAQELWTGRNLSCSCARCSDPTELGTHSGTLKCLDCPGYILPSNSDKIANCDWICDHNCGKKLTTAKVAKLHYGLFLLIGRVRMEKKVTTDRLEVLLSTVEKYVHPRHFLCITVKRLLAKTYGERDLAALPMEELTRKSALSKEVWTTMSDPNILLHGATNVAECLLENSRADFELVKRRLKSEEWSGERAGRAIIDCRSLLSGIPEVCNPETFYPPRAKLAKDAADLDELIVSWAKSKRLKVPEK